jgi:hypothetical protein
MSPKRSDDSEVTQHVSFEVHTSAAKRRQHIAVGVSPRNRTKTKYVSREAAAAEMIAVAASRLEFLRPFFCGLTPAAMCCRRFATQNSATSKRVSEELNRQTFPR